MLFTITTNTFNPHLLIKILMTISLSILAIVLYFKNKTKVRHISMVFMVLSTLGDFFMTNLFHLGDVSLYPGAGLFILGHILIGLFYIYISKKENFKYLNKGFYAGLSITLFLLIFVEILAYTIPSTPQVIYSILVGIYMIIIGFNMVGAFSFSYSKKDKFPWLPIFVVLFLISDIFIFLDMLNINPYFMQFVWYLYPLAQLGIILSIEKVQSKKESRG